MGDHLNMSLESIISSARTKRDLRGGNNNRSNNARSNNGTRNNKEGVVKSSKRSIDKVTTQKRQSRSPSQKDSYHGLISVKFLVSNRLAGSIIGSGGASIKELVEVSNARVSVASKEESYPGTNDRILLITGKPNEVIFAQSLVWEIMAIQSSDEESGRRTVWSPRRSSRDTSGAHDDCQISGRLTIPAAAAGIVIGRSGATIRSISEDSGATLQVNSKEEAVEDGTNERILSIVGTKQSCCECLTLIIEKLVEGGEVSQYDDNQHMEQSTQNNENIRRSPRASAITSNARGSRQRVSENFDKNDNRKVITFNSSHQNSGSGNWVRGLEFEGNEKNMGGRSLSSSMNFSTDSNYSDYQNNRNSRRDSMDNDEQDYSRGNDTSRRPPPPLRNSSVDTSLRDSRGGRNKDVGNQYSQEARRGNMNNGRHVNAEILSTNTVINVAISDDHIGKIVGKQVLYMIVNRD